MKPHTECRICGNLGNNRKFTVREMMFGTRDEFSYMECGSCGCVQLVEMPEDLAKYYPSDYYSFSGMPARRASPIKRYFHRKKGEALFGRSSLAGYFMLRFRTTLGAPEWLQHTVNSLDDAVLDVGCGAGQQLAFMRQLGFSNLTGIDPYLEKEFNDVGLQLSRATLSDTTGDFDLIMFHHSFEHLPDPEAELIRAANRTRSGKSIVIRIPIADSHAYHAYGPDWVQLDAPRHTFLHTRKSMNILAGRAGLVMERVTCDSSAFQFWGSEQYQQGIPLQSERSHLVNPRTSLFSAEEISAFEDRAKELNSQENGDQACFYLRKRTTQVDPDKTAPCVSRMRKRQSAGLV